MTDKKKEYKGKVITDFTISTNKKRKKKYFIGDTYITPDKDSFDYLVKSQRIK